MHQVNTAYYFDSAILPPVFTICGVELKPFCLGHYIILRQFNSPVAAETEVAIDRVAGAYWLFHAILVCAQSYEDNLLILKNDQLLEATTEQFNQHLIKQMHNEPGWHIDAKLKLFKEYLNYFMELPMFTEETSKDDGAPSGTDWVQNIFVTFKKMGYTESEILNMNMRKLLYEWCSHAEEQGAIKVFNRGNLQQYLAAKGMLKQR